MGEIGRSGMSPNKKAGQAGSEPCICHWIGDEEEGLLDDEFCCCC